ncbi:carbohydrate phosphatase [Decorospora gaudefroyi]|uniref:Inositol-1-monophosphatase n=1 Tax=Decorospora gaudefroyi TaxID=184978 RepID=A0A6A5KBV8_9PLEO|nr:carbohydrate phosphatase [Decorospora gaudefroyi]
MESKIPSRPISSKPNSSSQSTPATTPPSTPDFDVILANHFLTKDDLRKIHVLLIDIAMDAGKMMMAAEHALLTAAQFKNNSADVVTEYDHKIETMVEKRIRAAYPSFAFLGEETFKHGTKLGDIPTFICDPIDGTLNFSKGVPNCAVSLALTLDKRSVIGVVYNPFRGDLYHAIKDQGAYLTKTSTGLQVKLPVQPVPPPMPSLQSCLVAVEWGNQRSGSNWSLRTSVHNALLTSKAEGGAMCKSVRSNGSAALNFCYVAHGMLDAFWEGGVWSWDVCAGWIILEEAGGIVASANPGDWNPTLEGRLYFAVRHAKREEQRGVVEELWGIMGERRCLLPTWRLSIFPLRTSTALIPAQLLTTSLPQMPSYCQNFRS